MSVSNIHGIYMEHITLQFWPNTAQYSQVIKFRPVASFCVLRNFTTDGADDQFDLINRDLVVKLHFFYFVFKPM